MDGYYETPYTLARLAAVQGYTNEYIADDRHVGPTSFIFSTASLAFDLETNAAVTHFGTWSWT